MERVIMYFFSLFQMITSKSYTVISAGAIGYSLDQIYAGKSMLVALMAA